MNLKLEPETVAGVILRVEGPVPKILWDYTSIHKKVTLFWVEREWKVVTGCRTRFSLDWVVC